MHETCERYIASRDSHGEVLIQPLRWLSGRVLTVPPAKSAFLVLESSGGGNREFRGGE